MRPRLLRAPYLEPELAAVMPMDKRYPKSHARIRDDHATELAEDYVEAIAELLDEQGNCRAADLVAKFDVSHVTVNRTLGRLIRDGYVESEPYGPVFLTAKGRRLAKRAHERHQVVLKFLMAIGVAEPTAVVDSEGIEHHVSDETLEAMRAFLRSQQQSSPES